MLTDIFAFRYGKRKIWASFGKTEKRLIVQTFSIINEQLFPYYQHDGSENPTGKAAWNDIQKRLAVELGLISLSPLTYSYSNTWAGKETKRTAFWPMHKVCENWVHLLPNSHEEADEFIKERLSLVEIAFRKKEQEVEEANEQLPELLIRAKERVMPSRGIHLPGDPQDGILAHNRQFNESYQASVEELNTRFRQARCGLHYHNGFIQISDDDLTLKETEQPFWNLLRAPIWKNVDIDMKEAIDRRDAGGRDPTFYAARALESAIKIISDKKQLSHGKEKGAHNFIDNLSKKSVKFIERWEAEALKHFFTHVRNPFGHGPGSQEMPTLTTQQTEVTVEFCMSWIKSLARRL